MLAKDIREGSVYVAKVSNVLTRVRVDRIETTSDWKGRASTRYHVTNLRTNRKTVFRSAAKFRSLVSPEKKVQVTKAVAPVVEQATAQVREVQPTDGIEVGSTVVFVGPEYGHGVQGPTIGERGVVTERAGHYMQEVGGEKEELVTVKFPLDDRPSVVNINRLRKEGEQGSDPQTTPSSQGRLCTAPAGSAASESCKGSPTSQTAQPSQRIAEQEGEHSPPFGPGTSEVSVTTDPAGTTAVTHAASALTASANGSGLKGDQARAFEELTARIKAGQVITKLCGFAGTGKTWLLSRLALWAKGERYEVTIAAPTHKAAGVISEKLEQQGVGGVTVRTIHSLLGLRLEPDYEGDTGGRILQATDGGKSKVKQGLVICDEASMVGKTLKEHIESPGNRGIRWLFVGDLAQLPPVGESISELLDDPDSTLEQVLRQQAGSEILNVATAIRQGDLSMSFEEGKDVHRVEDAEALFQAARGRFESEEFRKSASHARMLVFRNVRREAINRRMRDLLVGSPDPFVEGEWLVMYQQFSPAKSRLNLLAERAKTFTKGTYQYGRAWRQFFNEKEALGAVVQQLHTSEEVHVEAVQEGQVSVGKEQFRVWTIEVTAPAHEGQRFTLTVLHEDEKERVEQMMADLASQAQAKRQERDQYEDGCWQWRQADDDRKRLWSTYFTLEETFAQVDYCYAMTVHKSQGSTFDHVFVDVPDLLSSGGMQQRILYTACTRPAKSLTFYT